MYHLWNKLKRLDAGELTSDVAYAVVKFKKKIKSVAYSSQGSHTGQLDFCNWQYNKIMWLPLHSIKSNDVDFLNQIYYFSIK